MTLAVRLTGKTVEFAYHALAIDEHRAPFAPSIWAYVPKLGQTVEQVWFCGVHSDIGGGYVQSGLSDIALGWMIEKACGVGLKFDDQVLCSHPLKPDPLAQLHNSKTGLYRLPPGIDRSIGIINDPSSSAPKRAPEIDPTQSLHPSVLTRWNADSKYRHKELATYFKMIKDPRRRS
jgi:hypothetical protein